MTRKAVLSLLVSFIFLSLFVFASQANAASCPTSGTITANVVTYG